MRQEDLEPFAVADGLLAQMAAERAGKLTDVEHRYMLDRAREALAKATGETLENAGRLMSKPPTKASSSCAVAIGSPPSRSTAGCCSS